MSGISQGSKATTNLFMLLGILALIALVFAAGRQNEESLTHACGERLITMGAVVWDPTAAIPEPGESHMVSLGYRLTPSGEIADIEVSGAESPYDATAINALRTAKFKTQPDAEDLLCQQRIRLQLD